MPGISTMSPPSRLPACTKACSARTCSKKPRDRTTGEMDKIDGPYYFFKLIQRLRQLLPPWMPTVGLEGGRVNIVPVDFVVNALNVISHQKDITKKCYHLVDPVGYRVGDVLDIFSRAAHA